MAYQSLYRRYRPSRFSELRGQAHVVAALQNAVRGDTVTHAYLFSGPRGTGKTSTARILARALNCLNPTDGEPCGECQSCKDMEAGRSFDLFELDAASNNGVDAIRDLIERAAVGSPGRTKVYILDEVHMLSPAASNALLKTLEEPPSHVRFVLATTDPQKVLPTIKSRTQHFEFQLLSAEELEDYVRWIAQDANLDLDDESIHWAVRQGRGSARDTLSALDQVVAAGGVVERAEPVDQLLEALAEKNPGIAISAIADALNLGHDPRVLARSLLDVLRDIFLISLDAPVPQLVPEDVERMRVWASKLGTPLLTRSMEAVGASLVDMRQAADPRVPLEVAFVRLSSPSSASVAELVERIERLEATIASGGLSMRPPDAPVDASGRTGTAESTVPATATAAGGALASSDAPAGAPSNSERRSAVAAAPLPPRSDATAHSRAGASSDSGIERAADAPSSASGDLSGPAKARAELARQKAKRDSLAANDGASSRSVSTRPARSGTGSAPVPPGASTAPPSAPRAASPSERRDRSTTDGPVDASTPSPEHPDDLAADAPVGAPTAADQADAAIADGATAADAAITAATTADALTVDALNDALANAVLPNMRGIAKSIYSQGSFCVVSADGTAVYLVENSPTAQRAEASRTEVESLLSTQLGQTVRIRITDDAASVGGPSAGAAASRQVRQGAPPPGSDPNDERGSGGDRPPRTPNRSADDPTGAYLADEGSVTEPQGERPTPTREPEHVDPGNTSDVEDDYMAIDVSELDDADVAQTGVERLLEAFPGAKVLRTESER